MRSLQLVIPIYNEEDVIPELVRRLQGVFERLPELRCGAILVDDGSRDRSVELLQAVEARDPRFRLVRLARNFGHQPAIAAGISVAEADAIVVMDGDLQDPPELILEMVPQWLSGLEVVRAERISRQEHGLRRLGFGAFHKFFNRLSDYPIPANSGVFCLLDREAYRVIDGLSERHRFFPGLCAWVGFRQGAVLYHRQERHAGTPKQDLKRLTRYALDAVFSFSYIPLRLMTYGGIFISCLGFSAGLFFFVRRVLGIEVAFTGFTTLVILVSCLGGLQLMGLGIVGEYLARVYDETKKRPYFIIRQPKERP